MRFSDRTSDLRCDEVETGKQVPSERASIVPSQSNSLINIYQVKSLALCGSSSDLVRRDPLRRVCTVDVSLPFATRTEPNGQKPEFGGIHQCHGGGAAKRCSLWGSSCSPNPSPSPLLYVHIVQRPRCHWTNPGFWRGHITKHQGMGDGKNMKVDTSIRSWKTHA